MCQNPGTWICAFFAAAVFGSTAAWADEFQYRRVVQATVLIVTDGSFGTGVVVDMKHRLFVTANHVVEKQDRVTLIFPVFDWEGKPVTDADRYLKSKDAPKVRGKVIARRLECDLALIQLEQLADSIKEMPLSQAGAREGADVFVVGHSNIHSGAIFGFSSGKVRNIVHRKPGPTVSLSGRIVLTSVATNRGDSGGPLFDGKGELVGIVSRGTTGNEKQQVVDQCIDVSEIRTILDANRPNPSKLEFNPYEPQVATTDPQPQAPPIQWTGFTPVGAFRPLPLVTNPVENNLFRKDR